MTLSTTINGHATSTRYPCLRVLKTTANDQEPVVVLFTNSTTGTVICRPSNNSLTVGMHSKAWECENFADFVGEVTLHQD